MNVLNEEQPTTITLGDGKEYTLPPINLNTLAEMEDNFECGIDRIMELFAERSATTMRKFLYILLKENHPKLTLKGCLLYTSPSPRDRS